MFNIIQSQFRRFIIPNSIHKFILFFMLFVISLYVAISDVLQFHPTGSHLSGPTIVLTLDSNTFIKTHSPNLTSNPYIEIEKTTDYGQSWKTVYYSDSLTQVKYFEIMELLNLGDGIIWAQSKNDRILESTDYGETWEKSFFPFDTNYIMGNICVDKGNLACVVWPDTFAISTDRGKTWTKNIIEYNFDSTLYDRKDVYTHRAFLFGDTCVTVLEKIRRTNIEIPNFYFQEDSHLILSTDGGITWDLGVENSNKTIRNVVKTNSNSFYYSANYYIPTEVIDPVGDTVTESRLATQLCKTSDFAKTYDTVFTNIHAQYIKKVNLFENSKIYLTLLASLFVSDDNGQTFYEIDYKGFPDMFPMIDDSDFYSSQRGMVTFNKSYATIEQTTSVEELNRRVDRIKVYPNPISSGELIHLRYEVLDPGEYSYSISDLAGHSVTITPKAEYLTEGNKEVNIQLPSELAAGTYFLNIMHNGNITAITKFILAR